MSSLTDQLIVGLFLKEMREHRGNPYQLSFRDRLHRVTGAKFTEKQADIIWNAVIAVV